MTDLSQEQSRYKIGCRAADAEWSWYGAAVSAGNSRPLPGASAESCLDALGSKRRDLRFARS